MTGADTVDSAVTGVAGAMMIGILGSVVWPDEVLAAESVAIATSTAVHTVRMRRRRTRRTRRNRVSGTFGAGPSWRMRRDSTAPLFLEPAGLADGLALKEQRVLRDHRRIGPDYLGPRLPTFWQEFGSQAGIYKNWARSAKKPADDVCALRVADRIEQTSTASEAVPTSVDPGAKAAISNRY